MPARPYVVALEEHYWDRELATHFKGADGTRSNRIRERRDDVGPLRLQEVDEAGIDVQVISHGAPSLRRLDGETAEGASPLAISGRRAAGCDALRKREEVDDRRGNIVQALHSGSRAAL